MHTIYVEGQRILVEIAKPIYTCLTYGILPQMRHMPNIDLSPKSAATYRIIRAALGSKEPFFQIDISKAANASPSQVSRVLRWMMGRQHADRLPDGRYRVRNAIGIIASAIPYQRSMKDARFGVVFVRGKKKEVVEALIRAGGILCLESALEEYSQSFRADRICIYHQEPGELMDKHVVEEGGILPVSMYLPDLPLKGDVEQKRRTSRFRTVIDLACDGRIYAAKDIVEELWGIRIE